MCIFRATVCICVDVCLYTCSIAGICMYVLANYVCADSPLLWMMIRTCLFELSVYVHTRLLHTLET